MARNGEVSADPEARTAPPTLSHCARSGGRAVRELALDVRNSSRPAARPDTYRINVAPERCQRQLKVVPLRTLLCHRRSPWNSFALQRRSLRGSSVDGSQLAVFLPKSPTAKEIDLNLTRLL